MVQPLSLPASGRASSASGSHISASPASSFGSARGRRSSLGTARAKVGCRPRLLPALQWSDNAEFIGGRTESRSSTCTGASLETPRVLDKKAIHTLLQKSARQPRVFSNGNSYVGAMKDKQMHGKGLYTWKDGSSYEGEFRAGKMWGEGERIWPDKRRYVGQWREDMMWGNGEMLWPSGETYVGQFRKGAFHGHGTRVWASGDKYVGDFSDGEQEGEGQFYSADGGWVYEGRWLHGRMYGEGKVEWPDGTVYIGEWSDGIREGRGRLEWPDGSWYEGPFQRNNVEGYGRKVFADGASYEGQFEDGEFEGSGTFRWPDGTEFEGLWRNSEIAGPGCHRLPDGSEVEGAFEDFGAFGAGTKRWANGCVFEGALVQSLIDRHGTLKWPDGRCYVGDFEDDALHGQGTLVWNDAGGTCSYTGEFANNLFEGRGHLEWSSGARYEGEFKEGLYHGEGTFEWPGGTSSYRGQWACGGMSGQGTLTHDPTDEVSDSYVYVGAFGNGHMEGQGHVTFNLALGDADEYKGEFKSSRFSGLGTFTWGIGASLSGIFEDNYCSRVGRKVYPDGRIYTGELRFDLEHGKGVMSEAGGSSFVALWSHGKVVKELLMARAQELDLNILTGGHQQTAFDSSSGSRGTDSLQASAGRRKPLLPVSDEHGQLVDGKAHVLFLNGDRYIGRMKAGRKHGLGMYVYADLATYRGLWIEDVLDNVRHPVTEDSLPIEVRWLREAPRALGPVGASENEEDFEDDDEGGRNTSKKLPVLAKSPLAIPMAPHQLSSVNGSRVPSPAVADGGLHSHQAAKLGRSIFAAISEDEGE